MNIEKLQHPLRAAPFRRTWGARVSNRLACLALIAALMGGGCCGHAPYVAVPEGALRIEDNKADRIALPLDAESTDRIRQFIQNGGVRHRNADDNDTEASPAMAKYEPLLTLLQSPEHLTLNDVTVLRTFGKWLKYPAIRDVVDAREWNKVFPRPAALTDGQFWWIFFPNAEKRLSTLLVVNSRTEAPE
jgi:hypothetical protein